ncbi:hypothetical protein [Streptomyces aidingensis]|uniref:Uncharacterized protein n=1 Tax=Streptomyces aidingensis TaxID=910347 RepID=A0A1I1Q1F2_9ACTN|nr:hypothetical protein [Streptomyces aidingensis]SFD13688.1 hypothetical protein SAMN05421773_11071 [Streptomyces aidingensis]
MDTLALINVGAPCPLCEQLIPLPFTHHTTEATRYGAATAAQVDPAPLFDHINTEHTEEQPR